MVNDKRRQQHGQLCLGIVDHFSPSRAMAIMAVAQTMVRNNNGGGSMDNGALGSLAVHCLLVQRH
jgi:hypothetical protein